MTPAVVDRLVIMVNRAKAASKEYHVDRFSRLITHSLRPTSC
jgi:hypothetical protein